ncbi:MAG: NgoBV family restriction endonuclease [Rikenellaceae bacterium]
MRLSAQQVFDKLVTEYDILNLKGQIRFHIGDVSIIVKQKDVVGNLIQEWLMGWFDKNNIEFSLNDNSQMPPDYYLNSDDKTTDLLEVKAFNFDATPAFDIADFNAYQAEIIDKPYMLHAKYLIFGYIMTGDGDVIIKQIWLKNVWEICRRMENWSLNLQVKSGVVHKIRPCTWYSTKRTTYRPFESLEHYISAIEESVFQNPKTHSLFGMWRKNFLKSYKKCYNKDLSIPKWSDISEDYNK